MEELFHTPHTPIFSYLEWPCNVIDIRCMYKCLQEASLVGSVELPVLGGNISQCFYFRLDDSMFGHIGAKYIL